MSTGDRLVKRGLICRNICPLCKQAPDSIDHRVHHCERPDVTLKRNSLKNSGVWQYVERHMPSKEGQLMVWAQSQEQLAIIGNTSGVQISDECNIRYFKQTKGKLAEVKWASFPGFDPAKVSFIDGSCYEGSLP